MSRTGFSHFTPGVLPGSRPVLSIQDSPQLASCLHVSEAGALFELDATRGSSYGPAPWCLGPHATVDAAITAGFCPVTGDRLLVVFAGTGIEAPVVLAWWR